MPQATVGKSLFGFHCCLGEQQQQWLRSWGSSPRCGNHPSRMCPRYPIPSPRARRTVRLASATAARGRLALLALLQVQAPLSVPHKYEWQVDDWLFVYPWKGTLSRHMCIQAFAEVATA